MFARARSLCASSPVAEDAWDATREDLAALGVPPAHHEKIIAQMIYGAEHGGSTCMWDQRRTLYHRGRPCGRLATYWVGVLIPAGVVQTKMCARHSEMYDRRNGYGRERM